ncbi:MAG: RIO1 family regulatory kinase/ATPase [Campylobacterota bacterium]|nr:RIO1 family regulatory kinase/ATPase [Campylobacterota bacterium]
MTKLRNLEEFIKYEISLNDSEIFSVNFEDKKYWIKKARETKSTNMHKLFYAIFNIDVLLPVEYKNGQESIVYEVEKLKRLKTYGVNVPYVIYQDKNNFVLEDCGQAIYGYIREPKITEDKMYYFINKSIEQLSIIHNNNDFHGGAQCRNFTYKDDKVYVIDFEESFINQEQNSRNKNIDIKTLQFRDLLLFILSLTKNKASFEIDYKMIILYYIKITNNNDFINRFKSLINKISFLTYLSKIGFIYNFMGKDLKSFFRLIDILKTLDIIDISKEK